VSVTDTVTGEGVSAALMPPVGNSMTSVASVASAQATR
jgi:hypothetical protein